MIWEQEEPELCNEELVVNISSICLSDTQIKLLSKGLSFCPVYGMDWFKLDVNLYNFFRNIRLKTFFAGRDMMPSYTGDADETRAKYRGKEMGLCNRSTPPPPR